jgi:hypothetical protein
VFWQNRVDATHPPITNGQTRVPEVPDQTEFLTKWFEFARGYKIVRREDGSEGRVAVIGEPLRDVPPGQLPRSLNELRQTAADQGDNGANNSIDDDLGMSLSIDVSPPADISLALQDTERIPLQLPSVPDFLPETAVLPSDAEERAQRTVRQARRIASLRRELNRLRSDIERVMSGLNELGEDIESNGQSPDLLAERLLSSTQQHPGLYSSPARTPPVTRPSVQQAAIAWSAPEELVLPRRNRHHPSLFSGRSPLRAADDSIDSLEDNQIQQLRQERLEASQSLHIAVVTRDTQRERIMEMELELEIKRLPDSGYDEGLLQYEELLLARAKTSLAEAEEAIVIESQKIEMLQERLQERVHSVRLGQDSRSRENWQRVFGTREEIQGEDYESPIGGMFTRAWGRFRQAEEERQQSRVMVEILQAEDASRDYAPEDDVDDRMIDGYENAMTEYLTSLHTEVTSRPGGPGATRPRVVWLGSSSEDEDDSIPGDDAAGLDDETDDRPAPKEKEEMTVSCECKICYQQIADIVLIPCGHCVMCEVSHESPRPIVTSISYLQYTDVLQWCSKQLAPPHPSDQTQFLRPVNCPVCRKRAKKRVCS